MWPQVFCKRAAAVPERITDRYVIGSSITVWPQVFCKRVTAVPEHVADQYGIGSSVMIDQPHKIGAITGIIVEAHFK